MEVLLVDDGSLDGSLAVCEDYAHRDRRIVLVQRPHLGVSSARNAGIAAATGQYIQFVDSDDYLDGGMTSSLVSATGDGTVDLVVAGFKAIDSRSGVVSVRVYDNLASDPCIMSSSEFLKHFAALYRLGLINSPCNKLYRAAMLNDSCIAFDSAMSYGEDLSLNLDAIRASGRFAIVRRAGYNYRVFSSPSSLYSRPQTNMYPITRDSAAKAMSIFPETEAFRGDVKELEFDYARSLVLDTAPYIARLWGSRDYAIYLNQISEVASDPILHRWAGRVRISGVRERMFLQLLQRRRFRSLLLLAKGEDLVRRELPHLFALARRLANSVGRPVSQ